MWVLNYKHFYEYLGKKDLEILPKFTKFPNFRGVLKKVLLFGVSLVGKDMDSLLEYTILQYTHAFEENSVVQRWTKPSSVPTI